MVDQERPVTINAKRSARHNLRRSGDLHPNVAIVALVLACRAALGAVAPARAQLTEIRAGDAAQSPGEPGAPAHRAGRAVAVPQSAARAAAARRAQSAAAASAAAPRQRRRSRNTSAAAGVSARSSRPIRRRPYPQHGRLSAADTPPAGGRRGDAFDPNSEPNAPGVPRTLGVAGQRRVGAAAR